MPDGAADPLTSYVQKIKVKNYRLILALVKMMTVFILHIKWLDLFP